MRSAFLFVCRCNPVVRTEVGRRRCPRLPWVERSSTALRVTSATTRSARRLWRTCPSTCGRAGGTVPSQCISAVLYPGWPLGTLMEPLWTMLGSWQGRCHNRTLDLPGKMSQGQALGQQAFKLYYAPGASLKYTQTLVWQNTSLNYMRGRSVGTTAESPEQYQCTGFNVSWSN